MGLSEIYILVQSVESVGIGLRMNGFPFQNVFRGNRVEIGFDDAIAAGILAGKLSLIDGNANGKVPLERILESWRAVGRSRATGQDQQPCTHEKHDVEEEVIFHWNWVNLVSHEARNVREIKQVAHSH